ncbi:MAG: biotin transporter BioY, partial [Clostridia bacterium]|nr:biotin transporter BioY [Clostridia bacterium]
MNARDLGYVSLSVALISVSAWLGLPVGEIPVTLQTAMIFVTAGLLGWKRATLSVTAYLLLGFVGVPVFAGFAGGAGKILSPTGGYLVGFLPLAFSVG